uniref:G-protein coupled receptors family 3 profile domain-containing protein n=1 Tax=Ditylenchus dipsaci TaxID=166011 RepID=A0A915E035_9BILA
MTAPSSMIALVFASVGIVCTVLVVLLFLNHNSTPVVKSTTRELSYIILGGICACYICTLLFWRNPVVDMFCVAYLATNCLFYCLLCIVDENQQDSQDIGWQQKEDIDQEPRFLSTFSQVVITWLLVAIQCIIVAVGVMQEMPQAGFESHFMPHRMVLVCPSSPLAFMAPFTRNLPENFNEAKFIGFTMYCTLVVWGAFVVLYFNAVNKALTMSFTFSISGSIALALLFFPKIFIIVLHPEKNVRSSYTTTKLIRCHFGNSQAMGSDSKHFSSGKTRTSSQSISINNYGCKSCGKSALMNFLSSTNFDVESEGVLLIDGDEVKKDKGPERVHLDDSFFEKEDFIELQASSSIFFCDEPFSNVNKSLINDRVKKLMNLAVSKIVIVTISLDEPYYDCFELIDRFCILYERRIIFEGSRLDLEESCRRVRNESGRTMLSIEDFATRLADTYQLPLEYDDEPASTKMFDFREEPVWFCSNKAQGLLQTTLTLFEDSHFYIKQDVWISQPIFESGVYLEAFNRNGNNRRLVEIPEGYEFDEIKWMNNDLDLLIIAKQFCPTRTASLHVANNQNNSNNAASNTQSSAISLANNNNNSNTISSHHHHHHHHSQQPSPLRHRDVSSQTDQCGGQQAHPQSRFMRTFSVMGGDCLALVNYNNPS